jgi:hypothetical protein
MIEACEHHSGGLTNENLIQAAKRSSTLWRLCLRVSKPPDSFSVVTVG